jgi:hypothetical protein
MAFRVLGLLTVNYNNICGTLGRVWWLMREGGGAAVRRSSKWRRSVLGGDMHGGGNGGEFQDEGAAGGYEGLDVREDALAGIALARGEVRRWAAGVLEDDTSVSESCLHAA